MLFGKKLIGSCFINLDFSINNRVKVYRQACARDLTGTSSGNEEIGSSSDELSQRGDSDGIAFGVPFANPAKRSRRL